MKNPPPPAVLRRSHLHRLSAGSRVWRIVFVADEFAIPFGDLRRWGPTEARWDPQRGRPGRGGEIPGADDPERGVLYVAEDLRTCVAEVYQDEDGHVTADTPRVADIAADGATALSWRTTRALDLLDLTGDWALQHGAAWSLVSAERALCRQWARALVDQHPDLDGLWVPSAMTGRPMPVLFTPAADSFPATPDLSRLLADPAIRPHVEAAAQACGYLLVDGPPA